MADVLLFHHALGLTSGIASFAETLLRNGHTVTTPDLFEGRTFATVEEGVAHAQSIGIGELIARGERAASSMPENLVYAGFSLGVLPAQKLAQTRPGAAGALFFYSCLPLTEFGSAWPKGVPVQVHAMDHDPVFMEEGDLEAARDLVSQADSGELFLYPGDEHYFAEPMLPSFRPEQAALLAERVLAFLDSVGLPTHS
ncbi:dienelactone hydrolase family protein [Sinomonas flava]|uniref:Dienelactone hydrolase family protein n=1 Tax=Sinomonas flava TaxID=496857 RepID=A0ABN3BI77_9MICC